jgi:hypothetical protein
MLFDFSKRCLTKGDFFYMLCKENRNTMISKGCLTPIIKKNVYHNRMVTTAILLNVFIVAIEAGFGMLGGHWRSWPTPAITRAMS